MYELETVAGLFPGQGSYRPGCFARAWHDGDPDVRLVYETIDAAAARVLGKRVTPTVFAASPPASAELLETAPDVLQLAIFAQSLAAHRLLARQGTPLSWLAGHSMGEITALVAAGAYTVADGAELLCHRIEALREHDPGGRMLAVKADAGRVAAILSVLDDPDTVVAVRNGPSQIVVSGPVAKIDAVAAITAAVGVKSVVVNSPHPFHNPMLADAARQFASAASAIESHKLATPVYSPILGRFYRDGDDFAALLAQHLLAPVEFDATVNHLYRAGARLFVEFGPGSTLGNLVLAQHPVATVLDAFDGGDERAAAQRVAGYLGSGAVSPPVPTLVPATAVVERPVPMLERAVPMLVEAPQPPVTHRDETPAAEAPAAVTPAAVTPADSDGLLRELRTFYAQALEYPEEVLTEDALLEGDLGVDSVQQTELLATLHKKYGLDDDARLDPARHNTLAKILDHLRTHDTMKAGS